MAAPFLTYLTVFKARVGVCNVIVDLTGLAHQPLTALTRKLVAVLEERQPISVDEGDKAVLDYLKDKRLITGNRRKSGRYREFTFGDDGKTVCGRDGSPVATLPVFLTDIWFADPAMASTIGVPTPENANECIELAFQLRLLTKSKNTWTAAGHLVGALQNRRVSSGGGPGNPFVLGPEGLALFRQVLSEDGVMLAEVAPSGCASRSPGYAG